jgi:hypothetical protein
MSEFLIRHPKTGEEYALSDEKAFEEIYKPKGFVIPKEQPNYGVPMVAPERKSAAKAKDADGGNANGG